MAGTRDDTCDERLGLFVAGLCLPFCVFDLLALRFLLRLLRMPLLGARLQSLLDRDLRHRIRQHFLRHLPRDNHTAQNTNTPKSAQTIG